MFHRSEDRPACRAWPTAKRPPACGLPVDVRAAADEHPFGAVVRQHVLQGEASVASVFKVAQDRLGVPDVLINSVCGGRKRCRGGNECFRWNERTDLYGRLFCRREFARRRGPRRQQDYQPSRPCTRRPSSQHAAGRAAAGGLPVLTRGFAFKTWGSRMVVVLNTAVLRLSIKSQSNENWALHAAATSDLWITRRPHAFGADIQTISRWQAVRCAGSGAE